MADINQVITLGIGTPSDIEHFILLGLNGAPVVVTPSGQVTELLSVLQITEFDNQVLSADFSKNVLKVEEDITVLYMSLRMGMFGEGMFGSSVIWGGATRFVYRTGSLNVRNVT